MYKNENSGRENQLHKNSGALAPLFIHLMIKGFMVDGF